MWHNAATVPVMAKEMSEKERGRGKALEQWEAWEFLGSGQHNDGVWGSAAQRCFKRDTRGQDVSLQAEQLTFPILHRGCEGPGGRSFADLRG